MAFEPRPGIGDGSDSVVNDDLAPRMLRQPADAPPPIGRVGQTTPIQEFRRELAAQLHMRATRRLGSLKATTRSWAGRVSGRADRRLLFTLAGAVDALCEHCDLLVDRLASQEALTADVVAAFGEDLARLRAEVLHVRNAVAPPGAPPR